MAKNLVIVESPAKARTIEKILGKDFTVKSCNGHIRDLSKKELSIDIENHFAPKYTILDEKKTLIKELVSEAAKAENVLLATDEDREGEAISWHLLKTLELDESKTQRITFHEITKNAILESIKSPRKINYQLVDAQQARRVLDRLVGYELSPLLWRKVKPALSAGRVQSVAVRLIVEREDEIQQFKSESYFRVTGLFKPVSNPEEKNIAAQLSIKFSIKDECMKFLELCKNQKFKVLDIETKPATKSPAPPFTTSSLQQEAAKKLGFPVAKTMVVAQQLYETGKITYMRTDSVNLSNLALHACKDEITSLYGKEYSHTRQFETKTKGAQEAHEAIRPTEMRFSDIAGTKDQKNLYSLIWKRTIASQMANALIDKTTITINSPVKDTSFLAKGEVIRFDGFLKVYTESSDDDNPEEEGGMLPKVSIKDDLSYIEIEGVQKFTQHQPRYAEASLVKKLEELGIGRPSTYAPTISTILKREYVVKETRKGNQREYITLTLKKGNITSKEDTETFGAEKNKLFPTDIGILVTQFLKESFADILDYRFTANVEKQFDDIAEGNIAWNTMIEQFYSTFHANIIKTTDESKKYIGERLLGVEPESGLNVYVKIGKYGPIVQLGDTGSTKKPRFASLLKQQSVHTLTFEDALELFKFPYEINLTETEKISINLGPYGPYFKFDNKFFQIPEDINPLKITPDEAHNIINNKNQAKTSGIIKEFESAPDLTIRQGKWGSYIKYHNDNFKIPKGKVPQDLTIDECMQIIEEQKDKPKKTKRFKRR